MRRSIQASRSRFAGGGWAIALLTTVLASVPVFGQAGKCCLPDGRGCVSNTTQDACDAVGGVFVAGQLTCQPGDTCEQPLFGACCPSGGGACMFVQNTQCGNGQFLPNSPCSPTICTPPTTGACCEDFQCRVTVSVDCQSPGAAFFSGLGCTPTRCGTPPTGACCQGGSCNVMVRTDCFSSGAGAEWYQGQPCLPGFCRLGACCTGANSCVIVTLNGCEQGTFTADGTCVPQFCIRVRGSCCRDTGQCVVTADYDCNNGTFSEGNPCTPESCAAAIGACCRGTACNTSSPLDCAFVGGVFQGGGSGCGQPGNPTTCCPANFNSAGGVSVQDIFDFLAAYFANEGSADFNHSGGLPTVQDIFDFLAAYFAGCA